MARINPQIILRADMVQPERVPPETANIFERLVNHILPELGIQIATEYFETGWLIFFGSMTDFRAIFSRPLFSNDIPARILIATTRPQAEDAMIWDYKFERLPARPQAATLFGIIKKFYTKGGSLGEGTAEEFTAPDGTVRIRVLRPSLTDYIDSLEKLVRNAHKALMTNRRNPRSEI